MPVSTIRVLSDVNQAIADFNRITGSLNEILAAQNKVNSAPIRSQMGGLLTTDRAIAGKANIPLLSTPTSQIDAFNRTLRTTYDLSILTKDSQERLITSFNKYHNLDAIIPELNKLNILQEQIAVSSRAAELGVVGAQAAFDTLPIRQQTLALEANAKAWKEEALAARAARQPALTAAQTRLGAANANLAAVRAAPITGTPLTFAAGIQEAIRLRDRALTAYNRALDRFTNAPVRVTTPTGSASVSSALIIADADRTTRAAKQTLATDRDILSARQAINTAEAAETGIINRNNAALATQRNRTEQAFKAPLGLPAPFTSVLRESPQTFNNLVKQGLGGGSKNFSIQGIYDQGAADNIRVSKDLEKGITTVSTQMRTQEGVVQNLSAKYNEHGTVIGRVGGQLSGLQNYLRQTTNDFVKLTQWTAATTILFTGLAAAVHSVGLIATFDKLLKQLAITSQASNEEIKQLFNSLTDISIKTATPLEELVKSADDMALATRRANQSTSEWRASTLELANAVGILTNIAAIDTVSATDKLAAIMKQLGLEASDLVGILNKITAVAGGQSLAVNDIVTGLAAMAEAAKQANLTIDESLAVIQVLGQVTSKSAAEIAVSFKNLTGSLGSPAAVKMLKSYNIDVKDTEGNLRNILEIYGEINDKIASGTIPQGNVQAVLRAIAGGPRRLPDAAALLANEGTIAAVAERSLNATNEALIANAKILDTIPAKVTQLQNAFEGFIQSSFGDAFKSTVGSVIDSATGLINILKAIPTAAYTGALQLGVFFLAIKLGGPLLSGLSFGLKDAIVNFGRVGVAARLAAAGITTATKEEERLAATIAANASLAGSPRSLGGIARNIGVGLKAGAAAGATGGAIGLGLSAASGGTPGQIIGGGLQGAGIGFLATAPPIGLALLGIGTALQVFTGKQEEATKAVVQSNEDLLQLIKTQQTAQGSIEGLNKDRATEIALLKSYSSTPADAAKNIDLINSTLKDYGNTLNSIADANKALAESFDALGKAAPDIQSRFDMQIRQAQAGQFNPDDLKKLYEKLSSEIFNNAYRDFKPLSEQEGRLRLSDVGAKPLLAQGSTTAVSGAYADALKAIDSAQQAATESTIDFKLQQAALDAQLAASDYSVDALMAYDIATDKLIHDQELYTRNLANQINKTNDFSNVVKDIDLTKLTDKSVLGLFSEDQKKVTAEFALTAQNVDLIIAALKKASVEGGEYAAQAQVALQTFTAIVALRDPLAGIDLFSKQQNVLLQTKLLVGAITGDVAKAGQANLKGLQNVLAAASTYTVPGGFAPGENAREAQRADLQARQAAAKQFALKTFTTPGGDVSTGKVSLEVARQYLQYLNVINDKNELLNDGKSTGVKIDADGISLLAEARDLLVDYVRTQQQSVELDQERLDLLTALKAAQANALSSYAQKSLQIQQDLVRGDITPKQAAAFEAGAKGTDKFANALVKLFKNFPDLNGNLDILEKKLSTIPGLQDVIGEKADTLVPLLIAWAASMDLTGAGAEGATKPVLALIAALSAVPPVINTKIQIGVGLQTAGQQLPTNVYGAGVQAAGHGVEGTGNLSDSPTYLFDQILKGIQDAFKKNFLKGTGSGGGGGGSEKPAPSLLDLSDAILENERRGLSKQPEDIKTIIANAKKLQSQIPGQAKRDKDQVVEILDGTKRVAEVRGISEELLRKSMDELAKIEKARLDFDTKADTFNRVRVGNGSFAALANVPYNSKLGVSVGGPQGPITVNLNVNGQVLTPAQMEQLSNLVAAGIGRQLASGSG